MRRPISYEFAKLSRDERKDLIEGFTRDAEWDTDYALMLSLSAMIASLGLLQNSIAIVIGAMVVAPLMTPLIAAGLALTQANLALFKKASVTVLFSFAGGLVLSFVTGLLVHGGELPSELVARGAPNLLDFAVAFLSGFAATYAVARPGLRGAVAGVAVAASLVPPLAAAGVSAAVGEYPICLGALVLFVTNVVAIVLGSALSSRILGLHAGIGSQDKVSWVARVLWTLVGISAVLAIPLWYQLAELRLRGYARPLAFPLTTVMISDIREHVSEVEGLHFVLAGRAGVRRDHVDAVVLLSADRPIDKEQLADVKREITQTVGKGQKVAVHVFREASALSNGDQ